MKRKAKPRTTRIRAASRGRRSPGGKVVLLVGTLKGAFILRSDSARRTWKIGGPVRLGEVVNHFVLDPRNRKSLLMAAKTGHLGPTVFRSTDAGKSWKEASRPPAFPKAPEGQTGRAVDSVFWLTPGHASDPGVWWAGTIPFGLFKSNDHGDTWSEVDGFNHHPDFPKWAAGGATPGGEILHSINIDPRNPDRMYLGLSVGGVFTTDDRGATWRPLNTGSSADFLPGPDKFPEFGQDPHCIRLATSNPDRLYQQNHCGVYRMDRPADRWERIGRNLPKPVGDIGFGIVVHPRDADKAWVFPMDGTEVWPRTSPAGKPALFCTKNGGKSWQRQDKGFPREQAYFTVFRQALAIDQREPIGLYLGSTAGEIWASRDEGKSWNCITRHLPRIVAIEAAEM